jgi:hypothetical protein
VAPFSAQFRAVCPSIPDREKAWRSRFPSILGRFLRATSGQYGSGKPPNQALKAARPANTKRRLNSQQTVDLLGIFSGTGNFTQILADRAGRALWKYSRFPDISQ